MKVGIVTVYDSANIGSFMQALAMQELVKMHGDEPYMIKTRSTFTAVGVFLGYNNAPSARSLKEMMRFTRYAIKHPKEIKSRYNKYKNYKAEHKYFDRIITVNEANKAGLDRLLLGSDEIWNSNQPAFRNPLLYGDGISADKKYGYAISVGNMKEDNWTKHPHLLKAITKLDAILARDKRTEALLLQNGAEVCAQICDPTLQVDIRSYMKEAPALSGKKYIAVYSYRVSDDMKKNIKRFAKENGLRIIAVSLAQPWCDEYINCSPLEFGAVLKNAEYVYTSTFHGTIFSILYHTGFVSMNAMPKVREVLELLDMSGQGICADCSYEEFCGKVNAGIDYDKVDLRIKELQKKSYDIYEKIIKGNG